MYYIHYFSVCCKISKFEAFNQATCGLSLLGGRNGPTAVEFEIKADGIESQTGFIHHPQSLLDGLLPNAQRWNGTDIFLLDLAKLFFHHLLPEHEHLSIFKQLQELRLAGRSYELGAEFYSFLCSLALWNSLAVFVLRFVFLDACQMARPWHVPSSKVLPMAMTSPTLCMAEPMRASTVENFCRSQRGTLATT